MIGYLKGDIVAKDINLIILNVNGVGYKIYISNKINESIESLNKNIELFIYTHVREDLLELFGFLEYKDLRLFESLIGISGIGPKTALGIFNIGRREEIINAIIKSDASFFSGVPRLGKKNAQKIIIELKSKFGGDGEINFEEEYQESADVVEAMKGFGYSSKEVYKALREVGSNAKTTEEKIRVVLKYLGK